MLNAPLFQKKRPRLRERGDWGGGLKNNLLPEVPIYSKDETESVPDAGEGTVLGLIVGASDGEAVVDGLRKYEVGHRYGTVVGEQFYGRLVDEEIEGDGVA